MLHVYKYAVLATYKNIIQTKELMIWHTAGFRKQTLKIYLLICTHVPIYERYLCTHLNAMQSSE